MADEMLTETMTEQDAKSVQAWITQELHSLSFEEFGDCIDAREAADTYSRILATYHAHARLVAENAELRDNFTALCAAIDAKNARLAEAQKDVTALREAVEVAAAKADFYSAIAEHISAEKHPADALLRWHRERKERGE